MRWSIVVCNRDPPSSILKPRVLADKTTLLFVSQNSFIYMILLETNLYNNQ